MLFEEFFFFFFYLIACITVLPTARTVKTWAKIFQCSWMTRLSIALWNAKKVRNSEAHVSVCQVFMYHRTHVSVFFYKLSILN